jgi:hypothetical protein
MKQARHCLSPLLRRRRCNQVFIRNRRVIIKSDDLPSHTFSEELLKQTCVNNHLPFLYLAARRGRHASHPHFHLTSSKTHSVLPLIRSSIYDGALLFLSLPPPNPAAHATNPAPSISVTGHPLSRSKGWRGRCKNVMEPYYPMP